jgi:hypothetical protein
MHGLATVSMRGLATVLAVALLSGCQPAPPDPAPAPPVTAGTAAPTAHTVSVPLPDRRTARLRGLGAGSGPLVARIAALLPGAAAAVSAFWGPDWPREIPVVVTDSADQFRALAHPSPDIAAATTADGLVFAPGAAAMSETRAGSGAAPRTVPLRGAGPDRCPRRRCG